MSVLNSLMNLARAYLSYSVNFEMETLSSNLIHYSMRLEDTLRKSENE